MLSQENNNIQENLLANYKVEVREQERWWDNPFSCCGDISMLGMHTKYNLGSPELREQYHAEDYTGWSEIEKQLKEDMDIAYILPVSMYDHSGLAFNIGEPTCRWDSGRVGFIFITREQLKKFWGWRYVTKRRANKLYDACKGMLRDYGDYMNGVIDYSAHIINIHDGWEYENTSILEEFEEDALSVGNKYLQESINFIDAERSREYAVNKQQELELYVI